MSDKPLAKGIIEGFKQLNCDIEISDGFFLTVYYPKNSPLAKAAARKTASDIAWRAGLPVEFKEK